MRATRAERSPGTTSCPLTRDTEKAAIPIAVHPRDQRIITVSISCVPAWPDRRCPEKTRSVMHRLVSPRLILGLVLLAALVIGATVSAQRSSAAMATAASAFLGSLSPEQRQRATFPFESEERFRWNFIPSEAFPRNGLLVRDMTEPQRALAHGLLKTGLSQRGYLTYAAIMELENILKALEKGGKFVRDPGGYVFSIFGTPGASTTWGWRVDGHHVSLHFTIVNGTAIASSPAFAGTNPAEVREGPEKGKRILAAQEDAGRALVTALDASQR